jgi:CMP-N-acetylneuraminic acid synthetase
MSLLAIIPARGGSRGVPRKNVRPMGGKPMIAWSIEAALKATSVARVIVSTDDEEIAAAARAHGADVPFMRPADLASDTASPVDVVLHATNTLEHDDWIVLLQPTSPLRTHHDIDDAVQLQKERNARAVVSVTSAQHPPQWMRRIDDRGVLVPWLGGQEPARRQDAETLYDINGAIYLLETKTLRDERTFVPDATHAYVMPAERSLDIDSEWDFHLADLVLKDNR